VTDPGDLELVFAFSDRQGRRVATVADSRLGETGLVNGQGNLPWWVRQMAPWDRIAGVHDAVDAGSCQERSWAMPDRLGLETDPDSLPIYGPLAASASKQLVVSGSPTNRILGLALDNQQYWRVYHQYIDNY